MQTIAQRYVLREKLGQGGMGVVYRAYDRLTGQDIALKQVSLETGNLELSARGTVANERLALAEEFRTLAGLRHPNIVSVLDYGFDEQRQPFYTMTLVEGGKTLLKSAEQLLVEEKLELLCQVLQALVYLHRRHVIHSDLKPANIMVTNGEVKLLDFGLAVIHGSHRQLKGAGGTLRYMAPELFVNQVATEASDLWALGIIMYELLTDEYPFADSNFAILMNAVLNQQPDFMTLPIEPPILRILQKLLEKDPQKRYCLASDVLHDLQQALHLNISQGESLRESFLQAAKFVGRDKEFQTLQSALLSAQEGQGSVWLVGGESGVGKSRLLNELRIHALVNGVLAVRGQGLTNTGSSYQLWQDVLPRLILNIDLAPMETAILQEIIPNIGELLEQDKQDIPPIPSLEGQIAQERLILTILSILERQPHPVLLIFEDLQWLYESLIPIQRLQRSIDKIPLLIVGSYRPDERPTLPADLPHAHLLFLQRLEPKAIVELSKSMLGDMGLQPPILNLMTHETEGNTFFMVEVARALAEEAGTLDEIGVKTLPISIFTEGMREILHRRLRGIAPEYYALLEIAAVTGRQLDLNLLSYFADPKDLEGMLYQGQLASVFEIQENIWQFTHDKLREAVIRTIENPAQVHQQVAEAIETLYDPIFYAEALMYHWQAAQNSQRELHYLLIVAEEMIDYSARYQSAYKLLQRGMTLDQPASELFLLLGNCVENRGDSADAFPIYEQALALAQQEGNIQNEVDILNQMSYVMQGQGNHTVSLDFAQEAFQLAQHHHYDNGIGTALTHLAFASSRIQGNSQGARHYLEEALIIYRNLNRLSGVAQVLRTLGILANDRGDYSLACQYLIECLELEQQVGLQAGIAATLNHLALSALYMEQFTDAHQYLQSALEIRQKIGDTRGIATSLTNLGLVAFYEQDDLLAQKYHSKALSLFEKTAHQYGMGEALLNLAHIASRQYQLELAFEYCQHSLAIQQNTKDHLGLMKVFLTITTLHFQASNPIKKIRLRENLGLALELNIPKYLLIALIHYAGWLWQMKQSPLAENIWQWITQHSNCDLLVQYHAQTVYQVLGVDFYPASSISNAGFEEIVTQAFQGLEE